MTEQQALAEAQRRFGKLGAVYCFHETFFEVGVWTPFNFMLAYGMGSCWETAFADAAERIEASPSLVSRIPDAHLRHQHRNAYGKTTSTGKIS